MKYIETLLSKYLLGAITEEEMVCLQKWIDEDPARSTLLERLKQSDSLVRKYEYYAAADVAAAKRNFLRRVDSRVHWFHRSVWKYAAVLIPAVIISLFFVFRTEKQPTPQFTLSTVEPGGSKAILILNDGVQVGLGENDPKTLSLGNSVSVEMSAEELTYRSSAEDAEIEYNTIVVPRGGEYRLTLSDGTRVCLNSESRLRFPVSFNGMSERKVQLSGEAYFEVAGDTARSFVVEVGNVHIQQYGTTFNINAYGDSPEVVLVCGSIGVSTDNSDEEILLSSGQKAVCGEEITVTEVDVNLYIEWTRGRFTFVDKNLREIAEILMRWYDVEIEVDSDVADLRFTGSVGRNETIHHIMNAVSYAQGVHVTVLGDKIKIFK